MNREQLYKFLCEIDKEFPVPLSKKVDLVEYTDKLISKATLYGKFNNDILISLAAGYDLNIQDNLAYIALVGTLPEHRGNGYAKELVTRFLEGCKGKNIKGVHLYTHATSTNVVKIYKNIGFEDYAPKNELRPGDIHLIYYL